MSTTNDLLFAYRRIGALAQTLSGTELKLLLRFVETGNLLTMTAESSAPKLADAISASEKAVRRSLASLAKRGLVAASKPIGPKNIVYHLLFLAAPSRLSLVRPEGAYPRKLRP